MLTAGGSDHSPILFIGNPERPKLPRPFGYLSMWLRDKECEQAILNRWTRIENINIENINHTLHLLGKDLTKWGKSSFGKVEEVIKEIRIELENIKDDAVNEQNIENLIKKKGGRGCNISLLPIKKESKI